MWGQMGSQQRRTPCTYCSGEAGGDVTEAKGQHGVGLAIKEPILQDVEKDGLAAQHISAFGS